MSDQDIDLAFLSNSIEHGVKNLVDEIIKEVIAKAVKEVEVRIAEKADAIALAMLKYYDIQRNREQIVITVKKDI